MKCKVDQIIINIWYFIHEKIWLSWFYTLMVIFLCHVSKWDSTLITSTITQVSVLPTIVNISKTCLVFGSLRRLHVKMTSLFTHTSNNIANTGFLLVIKNLPKDYITGFHETTFACVHIHNSFSFFFKRVEKHYASWLEISWVLVLCMLKPSSCWFWMRPVTLGSLEQIHSGSEWPSEIHRNLSW